MEFRHPDSRHADRSPALHRHQQEDHHGEGAQGEAPAQELPHPQREGHPEEVAQQDGGQEARGRGQGCPRRQRAQILLWCQVE